MKVHTNEFKNEINKMGRQIDGKIYYSINYNFATESNNLLITENNMPIISEQIDEENIFEIENEDIFSMSFIKNGNILRSLMKEFDFETKIELQVGTQVNPFFGVLVNGEYEYLDYGKYLIKSREFNMDTETWSYVCYDKMMLFMIDYKPLDITYPITIENFLRKICEKVGLTFEFQKFNNITWKPENHGQYIYSELFENKGYTYRDVLDKIAEIFGGNLLINKNENLTIYKLTPFPNESRYCDTFDENFLKDTKSSFNQKIGPINRIVVVDTKNELEYPSTLNFSTSNETNELRIIDNEFATNGNPTTIANAILIDTVGLEYYFCDFTTTGICYLDYLDRFLITRRNIEYPCLLLNNEITITQGIEENIFADETEQIKTENTNYNTSIMNSKDVSFNLNQQKNEIESKVSKDGIISSINQSAEEIKIQSNKIKLEGYTTINDGFSIDEQGNMTANNGTFNGLISSGKIEVGDGYTESNPYLSVGNLDDGINPYGVYIWDNGLSVIDYRGESYEPLIRTEKISGGYAQLKGNHVDAFAFNNVSLAEKKKDFELLKSGLEILKNIDIYKYHYKESKDKKKKIGVVIGDGFNYSKEITSEDNKEIDLYSFIAVCCKAIQEQQEEINELREMIKNGKH